MTHQTFHININHRGGDYTLDVHGPSGIMESTPFHLSLDDKSLEMVNTLRYGSAPPLHDLKHLGTLLHQALFPPEIMKAYQNALGTLEAGEYLRLKLNIRIPEFARYPWEVLYDSELFLSQRNNCVVMRTVDTTIAADTLQIEGQVHILQVQASPFDLAPLDLDASQEALRDACGDKATITLLEDATPNALREALRDNSYHILHFDGHATFDESTQQGILYLQDADGGMVLLPAEELADYLANSDIRLVVLNACHTATDGQTQRFSGLAQHILRTSNLPALAAMQFAVDDQAAIVFNQTFYKTLLTGESFGNAMVNSRQAMRERLPGSADWLAPVLFMRVEDGPLLAPVQPTDARIANQAFLVPPLPAYPLVGRDALVNKLKRYLLHENNSRMVALHGLPGVGKTVLIATLAHDADLLNHFEDGVLWASLGPNPNLLLLLGQWAIALGFTPDEVAKHHTIETLKPLIRSAIAQRKMLLVIDDGWESRLISHFYLGGMSSVHLVTTRSPSLAADWANGSVIKIGELEQETGWRLIQTLAPAAAKAEPQKVRQLVNSVAGLPLALILMARYLRKETHDSQPHRLTHALQTLQDAEERLLLEQPLLGDLYPSLPEGTPLSLVAVIAVSDDALSPEARELFYALSIFKAKPNTFSLDAALALTNGSPKAIDMLTDLGLVESAERGRYTIHQVIAEYASLQRDDLTDYRRLAAKHFVTLVQTPYWKNGYQSLDSDWQNISESLDWLSENNEHALFIQAVEGLTHIHLGGIGFLDARGHWHAARRLLSRALEGIQELNQPLTEASLLTKLGAFALRQGDSNQAGEHLNASRTILEALPLSRDVALQRAYLYEFLSDLEMKERRIKQAQGWLERGLSLLGRDESQDEEIRHQEGYLYVLLGRIDGMSGRFTEALPKLQTGLQLLPHYSTNAHLTGFIALSNIHSYFGELHKGNAYLDQAIQMAHQLGHLNRLATLWRNQGVNQKRRGYLDEAIKSYYHALHFHNLMGDAEGESHILSNLAAISVIQGDNEQVQLYTKGVDELVKKNHLHEVEVFAKVNLARSYLHQGELNGACELLLWSQQKSKHLNILFLLPEILTLQAEIARLKGNHSQALTLVEQAIEQASKVRVKRAEGEAWSIKGKILDAQQSFMLAEAAYQIALDKLQHEAYEYARTQLALAQHDIMVEKHLTKRAQHLLTQASNNFEQMQAKPEITVIRAMLKMGGSPNA